MKDLERKQTELNALGRKSKAASFSVEQLSNEARDTNAQSKDASRD